MKVTIQKLRCLRCRHTWVPTQTEITICPKCKSAYWNKKRKNRQGLRKGRKR